MLMDLFFRYYRASCKFQTFLPAKNFEKSLNVKQEPTYRRKWIL